MFSRADRKSCEKKEGCPILASIVVITIREKMGNRIGSKRKEKTALKPSLRDFFGQSAQACPLLLTLLALSVPQEVSGAVFNVTDPGDYSERLKEAPRIGTLRDAIRRAQKEPGSHTIVISTAQPIKLKSSLPPITVEGLKIISGSSQPAVIDGQKKYTLGAVPKNFVMENVSLQNLSVTGYTGGTGSGGGGGGAGLGGVTYLAPSSGTVTYNIATFSGNSAIGGNGGNGLVNYTGSPAGSGQFVEGGGGGAGPGGNGGNGEAANLLASASTSGGYGGGGGGGGGLPAAAIAAPGGSANSFGGGGGASDTIGGGSSPVPSNPTLPPNPADYMGANGATGSAGVGGAGGSSFSSPNGGPGTNNGGGGGGGYFLNGSNYYTGSGGNSPQGGGGGGAGFTSSSVLGSTSGGSSNSPSGTYLNGGGGGGGGGGLSFNSGMGGAGGVFSGGGGGGSSITSTSNGGGGAGGFGGGGGGVGAHSTVSGGAGGFLAGAGGSADASGGLFYGGGGGGGSGMGGAIFADSGNTAGEAITLVLNDCIFTPLSNGADGGLGGSNGVNSAPNGTGRGNDIFMTAGTTVTVNMTNTNPTIDIWGDGGARSGGAASLTSGGLNVNGTGTLTIPYSGGANRNYSGTITIGPGATLNTTLDSDLGLTSNPINLNGGTLEGNSIATSRTITLLGTGGTIQSDFLFSQTGGVIQGTGPLTLSGTGQTELIANTYTGGTQIGSGTTVFAMSGDGSLGDSSGAVTFLAGSGNATLDFSTGVTTSRTFNVLGNATLENSNVASSFSGPFTGSAQLKLNGGGTFTINANPSTTFSGTLVDFAQDLILTGVNPLGTASTLSLSNPATTTLTLESATLANAISVTEPVGFNPSTGTSTITGQISGSGDISLESSAGFLALTPTTNNTSYTGTFSANGNLQSSGTNPFGVGTLNLSGTTEFIGSGTYGNNIVNLTGDLTLQADSGTVSTFSTSTLFQGGLNFNISGPGEVQITSSNNTYPGATQLFNGAILGLSGTNPLSSNSVSIVSGNLHLLAPGVTLPNNFGLSNNTTTNIQADTGSTSLFTGFFDGNNTTQINFQGPGTLQIGASNTLFEGIFDLQSGTIESSGTNPLGVGSVILDGTALVLTGSGTYANNWTANATNTSITAQSGTSTFSGNFNASSGGIILPGPGTIVLSGTNTPYSGTIHLNGGKLQAANGVNLGGSTIDLGGGELDLTGSDTFTNPLVVASGTLNVGSSPNTWGGPLSGSLLNLAGSSGGVLILTANNSGYAGGFAVTGGAGLSVSTQGELGSGPVSLNGSSLILTGSNTFTNSVALAGTTSTLNLGGGSNTLSGAFTGSTPFALSGAGSLALTNASSFTGTTTLNGGTLRVSGPNPMGPNTITLDGGKLESTGNSSFTNSVSLNQPNSQILVDSGFTASFTGPLSGTGGLLFNSPGGTLSLTHTNTYSGITTLMGGALQTSGTNPLGTASLSYQGGSLVFTGNGSYANPISITGNQTITLNPSTSSTISEAISGSGAITFSGAGAVTLTSNSNGQTGGTVVEQGATLSVGSDGSLGQAASPFAFSTGGGTLVLTSPITFSARTFTLTGNGAIQIPVGTTTISSSVTGPGTLTVVDTNGLGGTLAFTAPTSYGNTVLQGVTLQLSGAGTLGSGSLTFSADSLGNTSTLNLLTGTSHANTIAMANNGSIISATAATTNTFTNTISGPGRLTLQGPGNFSLTANNSSYAGGLTIAGTTLNSGANSQLGSGNFIFNAGSTLNLTGNDTYGQHFTFASNATISSTGSTTNTFNGLLDGPGGFIYAGTGTLAVIGNNTYQGGSILSGGTLQVQGLNPLGTGLFIFNGGNLELLGTSTFTGPVQINSNGVIKFDANVVGTFSGNISGGGALTLNTLGTTVLTGNNSYSGGTTLSNGLLQVAGPSPLGTGTLLFNGGNLELVGNTTINNNMAFLSSASILTDNGTTSSLGGNLSGAGNLTKTGLGTLRLSGNSSLSGNTFITQGQLIVDGSIPSSAMTISAGGAILSGTGTVGNINVIGILEPGDGDPTGTLFAGNVLFQPGSVFRPTANNAQTSMLGATSITIEPNAILDPFLDPFVQKSYTIATGQVLGSQFTLAFSGSAINPVDVIYNADSIILRVGKIPFNTILPRGNLQKIADCFEQLTTSADLTAVNAVINLLPANVLGSAFTQLDPSFYNAIAYVEEAATYRTRAIYTAHAQNRRLEEDALWAVWGTGFGESIHQHKLGTDRGQSGYDDHLAGFVTGVDGWAINHLLLSGGFSYGHSTVHWNQANAESSVKSYTAFLGSTWFGQEFSVDGYMSYSYHKAQGHRKMYISPTNLVTPPVNSPIPFSMFGAPIDRRLAQNSDANSGTFHLGGLYAAPWQWGFSLLSFANLDYFVVSQNTFEEKGGGVLDMSLRSKTSDLLRPEIGVGIGYLHSTFDEKNFFGNATISFVREFRFTGRGTPTTFAGSACQFQLYGLFPQQNFVSTSIEIGVANYFNFGLTLNYTGIFGSHYVDNGGQLELTYLF